ncbi:hypothetical protein AWENTII_012207 [Aspergillus wentii]
MRLREQQHNQLLRQQPMMAGQMGQLNMRRNNMVPPNLQKTVLQNNTPGLSQQQLAQFQKTQQVQMMQQMQREHSDMDMNGHRPQSPASADNAPSPSKRPRLEGGPMNGQQLAPNGRGQGQGIPGQPNPLLMQNGMNRMNPAQFQAFQQSNPATQQKSIQGMPNGLINPGVMPNQTDLVPMPDGQGMYPMSGDYYGANGQMAQVRAGMQTPGGQHGNHALQDYQMQLMLLEQQNKRRLMMARQEQDSMARTDGQTPMPGQQGLPPGTSPGSRAGASPNPNDQMKRGTPKMPQTALPGSPSAADPMAQNRGSPASMNFNGGPMPPDMAAPFLMKGNMPPPSSNPAFSGPQMGQPIPAGAGNRGSWPPQPGPQGQPMAPHQSPIPQPQAGTPQERGNMPPPRLRQLQAPMPAGLNPNLLQRDPLRLRRRSNPISRHPRRKTPRVLSDPPRRQQPQPLMRTRRPHHPPKRSTPRLPPLQLLSPLKILTRLTRTGQMRLRTLLNSRHQHPRLLNLSSSNHHSQIRPLSSVTSTSQMRLLSISISVLWRIQIS